VRARLAVLSEMPAEFGRVLNRWSRVNHDLRINISAGGGDGDLPDRNTEYMLYQTLIGAWPISIERTQAYMLKATREAKQKTSWTSGNAEFEDALKRFIEAILQHTPFTVDLEQFVDRVKSAGRVNSLAQTLMKYTVPGVPDLYQGAELWDLSLVDPDNRRPVDYKLRAKMLCEITSLSPAQGAAEAMRRIDEGLPKLWTIHQALRLRRERPESFCADAAYTPLDVTGEKADHAIAYLRGDSVATAVPRLTTLLAGKWQKTSVLLPPGRWTNQLTGASVADGRVMIDKLLKDFPVALLIRD
jgi:(1->4)-alpha-D-glucan 1-alpha-D-glucosylmutase